MKTNNERVYKYISGLMSDDEKSLFEYELKNSEDLANKYESVKYLLDDLSVKSESDYEEVYFTNLLPKVRERLSAKKKKGFSAFVYLAPTVIAVMVLIFVIFNPVTRFDTVKNTSLKEILANSDSTSIAEYISDPIYSDYTFTTKLDNNIDVGLSDVEKQLSKTELLNMVVSLPVIDDYNFVDHLSEKEIEKAYESLLNKKIL